MLAFGGYWAAVFAFSAPSLAVRHLVLAGNSRVSQGEAAALLDGLKGENILAVDLELWRDRLRASSWVADADLRRQLPATIVVHITEREPVGIARVGDELFLVDASGGVIDEFGPRYADCNLPIIDGLLVAGVHGSKADQVRSRLVADLMTDVMRRPDVASRVSQIDVSNARDVKVLLDGDAAVIRLGDRDFLERIWAYVGLQASLRERVPAIDYVDLRFDDHVYVGPSAAGPAVTSADSVAAGALRRQ